MKHILSFAWITLLLSFFLIESLHTNAQGPDMKFGKVDKQEVEMTICPIDSSAEAVILGDVGQSYFEYDDNKGFILVFERYVRIKILKTDGYGWAEFEIPLYNDGKDEEKVITLKGRTYNMEKGKVEDTKLTNESVFEEQTSKYWKKKKVSMPGVAEGSVIELKYTIHSPFFDRITDWRFQRSIPVLWSEYEIRIPEYFKFSRNATGYVPFVINESNSSPRSINMIYAERVGDGNTIHTQNKTSTITYTEYAHRLAAENVPAMKEEPFTSSIGNYQAKIEYELHSYRFPGGSERLFTTSWQDVCDRLLEYEDFGLQLNRGGLVREKVNRINAITYDPWEKAVLAVREVQNSVKWNGSNSKFTTENLSHALSEKSGNSGDVNLLLILLLKELDLEVSPVVLSTKNNGLIQESHPEIDGLNYVIARVTIDGKEYLLDATEPYAPVGLLPFRCLNEKGLVVSKSGVKWVSLSPTEVNSTVYFAEMTLDPDGRMNGSLTVSSSGYNGIDVRERYHKEGESEYARWLKEKRKEWEVTGIEFQEVDSLSKPVKVVYTMGSDEVVTGQGDLLFFNVLLNFGESSNPFKKEKRAYPVDFGCPIKDVYSFSYEIPEGYEVETLPAPLSITLPDKGGSFRFSASKMNNKIIIISMLSLTKTFFIPSEYELLKEFFTRIVAKDAEQIVIKKL